MDRPRNNRREQRGQPLEEKQFDERVINVNRVARVVKGGRRFRFQALVVIGDHKGKVGVGVSKGADVTTAISKATDVAKKQIIRVALYKDTLPHEAEAKVAGAHIIIKPASAGTGLIAGGTVRVVLEVAGVKDALSKSIGSSNKINVAYASIDALASIKASKNWLNKPAKAGKAALETVKA